MPSKTIKSTIYLECTHTYGTEALTGIQRVVRHVVESSQLLGKDAIDYAVIPVIALEDRFVAIESLPDHPYQQNQSQPTKPAWTTRLFSQLRLGVAALWKNARSMWLINYLRQHPRVFNWLKKFYIRFKLLWVVNQGAAHLPAIEFTPNDILCMLDSSWHINWSLIEQVRQQSPCIVFVVYDLIPIQYPQFCDEYLIQSFTQYYARSLALADGFIAISEAVKQDFQQYAQLIQPNIVVNRMYDFFHLGADFRTTDHRGSIRSSLRDVLTTTGFRFLMVSTIEPRKNHAYVLDAFDVLWAQGITAQLIIVGRVGWKIDELMQRLQQHPQLNKQLFLFHDLTDAELSYAYQHSTALIFSSFAEGFGLPIIEALQQGLPVIASDIAVHREIGKEHVMYVDLTQVDSLVARIQQIVHTGIEPAYQNLQHYRWLSWRESAQQLLNKLRQMQQKKMLPNPTSE